jgi:site-specific DNA-methyltransferase (adenine-specific)
MVEQALFSSASAEWETPQNVFDYLNKTRKFELDVCATDENHKCPAYFTKENDSFGYAWHKIAKSAFMNPVYGNAEQPCKSDCKKKKCIKRGHHNEKFIPGIENWMQKAYMEAMHGKMMVTCLVPARTDAISWWHPYCMKANEVWLIAGRLSFINRTLPNYSPSENYKPTPAPFPSAIVIFDGLNNVLPAKPIFKTMTINKKTGEITVY